MTRLRDHYALSAWPGPLMMGFGFALWQLRAWFGMLWSLAREGATFSVVGEGLLRVAPAFFQITLMVAVLMIVLVPPCAWLVQRMSRRLTPVRFVLGLVLAYCFMVPVVALLTTVLRLGGSSFLSTVARYVEAVPTDLLVLLPGAVVWQWIMRERRERVADAF